MSECEPQHITLVSAEKSSSLPALSPVQREYAARRVVAPTHTNRVGATTCPVYHPAIQFYGKTGGQCAYFFFGILCLRMTPLAVSLNCLPHSGQSTYLSVTFIVPPGTDLYPSYSFIVISSYSLLPEPGHTPSGTCLFLSLDDASPPLVQSSGCVREARGA